MAVHVTREHKFKADELDAKMEDAVVRMASQNGLSIVERGVRRVKIAGMGVNGEVTWDERVISVKADALFAFGGLKSQIRGAIESALDAVCGQ